MGCSACASTALIPVTHQIPSQVDFDGLVHYANIEQEEIRLVQRAQN